MASKHGMRTDLVCFGLIRWLETAPTARRCWPAQSMWAEAEHKWHAVPPRGNFYASIMCIRRMLPKVQ